MYRAVRSWSCRRLCSSLSEVALSLSLSLCLQLSVENGGVELSNGCRGVISASGDCDGGGIPIDNGVGGSGEDGGRRSIGSSLGTRGAEG